MNGYLNSPALDIKCIKCINLSNFSNWNKRTQTSNKSPPISGPVIIPTPPKVSVVPCFENESKKRTKAGVKLESG